MSAHFRERSFDIICTDHVNRIHHYVSTRAHARTYIYIYNNNISLSLSVYAFSILAVCRHRTTRQHSDSGQRVCLEEEERSGDIEKVVARRVEDLASPVQVESKHVCVCVCERERYPTFERPSWMDGCYWLQMGSRPSTHPYMYNAITGTKQADTHSHIRRERGGEKMVDSTRALFFCLMYIYI